MTLGLAEVEERLRALRRRLNSLTALHAASLSVSAVCLVISGLVVVGGRGFMDSMRLATWGGLALCVAALAAAVVFVRRRWLDESATAHLADARGELTDRLATLVDLRARPRASRLAPVLVAQTLALGDRWRPQRLAPRRVPRSLYLVPLSLLALSASPLLAPEPPSPSVAQRAPVRDAGAAALAAAALPQAQPDGAAGGSVEGDWQGAGASANAPPRDGVAPPPDLARRIPSKDSKLPESMLGLLPDPLRQALLSAFHAEQMDRPRELAAQSDPERPSGDGSEGGEQRAVGRADRPGERGRPADRERPQGKQNRGPGDEKQPGTLSATGNPVPPQAHSAPDTNREGSSPAAGEGSSPDSLMGANSGEVSVGQDGAPTFKLTITSFLRAIEQKGNQPRDSSKTTGSSSTSGSSDRAPTTLSDRQLHDDALRKAEVPPEYEDLVRRVYSLRGEE